jgi:hypothetical protein
MSGRATRPMAGRARFDDSGRELRRATHKRFPEVGTEEVPRAVHRRFPKDGTQELPRAAHHLYHLI